MKIKKPSRKVIIIIVSIIAVLAYFGYRNITKETEETRYALAAVTEDTLIVSVSGSGQISALDQVDVKSLVKGDIIDTYVKKGDEVEAGQLIARVNDAEYEKALEEAEIAWESAVLDLEELLDPTDELTLIKAENAALQARNSLEKLKIDQETEYQEAIDAIAEAEDDIEKAREDVLQTVTDIFWDIPDVINDLDNILYSYEIAQSEASIYNYRNNISVYEDTFDNNDRDKIESFVDAAENDYQSARISYDPNFENYSQTTLYSDGETIENLLNETITTTKLVAQAIKSEVNLLAFTVDYLSSRDKEIYSVMASYQDSLKSYSSKVNNHLSSLLSIQRSLQSSRDNKINAERQLDEIERSHPLDLVAAEINLEEKEKSLEDLKSEPDELDIRIKKNTIRQKEDALETAQQSLDDCYILAPFNGVIADLGAEKDDSISAGTIVASIIAQKQIAVISFNEIDVANIKVGQRATLTFDAVSDLTVSGQVMEVDVLGQVTQGVVAYEVKILLDTETGQIKSGMSVTADIITDIHQNVLTLPNGAIKSQAGNYYVELIEASEEEKEKLMASANGTTLSISPKSQFIEIGSANDLYTEIVSGLSEGDIVIASTLGSTATSTTQTQNGQIQFPGLSGQGGEMREFR